MSDTIAEIAARLPEKDRHVPFMRLVFGWTYFECAIGGAQVRDIPLTEDAMRYIAAHWNDDPAAPPAAPNRGERPARPSDQP